MPKLAIYVPKKDWREIEKWRKKINFSRIFMQALTREIQERSRGVKASSDRIAAAADFYRQQLAESSAPLTDFSFKQGSEDVLECRLTPQLIQKVAQIEDQDNLQKADTARDEHAQVKNQNRKHNDLSARQFERRNNGFAHSSRPSSCEMPFNHDSQPAGAARAL